VVSENGDKSVAADYTALPTKVGAEISSLTINHLAQFQYQALVAKTLTNSKRWWH